MKCHIVDIRTIREESRQQAIDNAWQTYLAKVKAATEATRQMNIAHDEWMRFCERAAP